MFGCIQLPRLQCEAARTVSAARLMIVQKATLDGMQGAWRWPALFCTGELAASEPTLKQACSRDTGNLLCGSVVRNRRKSG